VKFFQTFSVVGLRNNGALIKLGISNNYIGAQKGDLQRICVASGIDLAM
jgi:hypothetical protein